MNLSRHINVFYGTPLDVLASCMRGMITAAPGNILYGADFSNIEGRALPWLAGQEDKLQRFRDADAGSGPGIYEVTAGGILDKPPSEVISGERQTYGKVPELFCQFGGGVGAGRKMAKTYLVKMSDDLIASVKTKWRERHPKIVQYWHDLERAAIDAVMSPGTITFAGAKGREVRFRVKGSFLWCLLPSARAICYPYPKIKAKETPWGEMRDALHYMTVDATSNKWIETNTYGGSLSQNVTEGVCRDLLVAAIRNCEKGGYPIVFHVHDEPAAEVKEGFGSVEEFERLCSVKEKWAEGLPVVAKGWKGKRWG